MALKQIPKIWLYVYPLQTAGGFTNITPFALADTVLQNSPAMHPDENLRRWDLKDEKTGLRTVGYTLAPTPGHMNATIGRTVQPATAHPMLDFTVRRGDRWATVMPDSQPGTTAVKWYSSDPDDGPFEAETSMALPRGQSWSLQLQTFGYHHDDAYLHIAWGQGYGIELRGGEKARMARWRRTPDSTEPEPDPDSIRELPYGAEQFTEGSPIWMHVHHIGGRVVLELEQGRTSQQVVYAHLQTTGSDPKQPSYSMKPIIPTEAPIRIRGYAAPFTARFAEMQYPESGHWDRPFDTGGGTPFSKYAYGFHPAPERSQGGPSETLGDLATITTGVAEDRRSYYRCSLSRAGGGVDTEVQGDAPDGWTASPTSYVGRGMGGQLTPFVNAVTVRYPGAIRSPLGTALDLSPAVLSMDMEIADPEIAPGTVLRARLNRDIIADCRVVAADGTDLGAVGSAWPTYLGKYHRAALRVAWQYDDGATGVVTPGGVPYGDTPMFDGWVWSLSPEQPSYGDRPTTVEFRDGMIRLQKPAGLVDGRFGPADMLLAEKMATNPSADARLYGWEIVQHIIEQSMGAEAAGNLQVRFPTTHYDLLQHKMLLEPPFGSGFFWPAQYGQSAADWIRKIADADFANFFWGPRATAPYDWVPYYGWYFSIAAGMPTVELPDSAYVADDANKILASAGWQQQPSQDFNVIQVWGRFPQDSGEYREFMPALPAISGAAIVAPTTLPEQDQYNTWARTLLLEGTEYWLPGVARAVATNRARLQRSIDPRRLPLKVRGDPYWWWGYCVTIKATAPQSDPDLWTPGEVFRVMRVTHRWVFGQAPSWETSLVAVPKENTS